MHETSNKVVIDAPAHENASVLEAELDVQGWLPSRTSVESSHEALCAVVFDDGGGRLEAILTREHDASGHAAIIGIVEAGDVSAAVRAMRLGAVTVLERKGNCVDPDELVEAIETLVVGLGPQERDPRVDFVRGHESPVEPILDVLPQLARSSAPVLLLGESGTGKDMLAEAIHSLGPRRRGPFIAVNCGAIPHDLIESELFGHVKGAFTGAHADRPGQFEAADGGTIFLDEIGEMPAHVQVKLLRVLQEKSVTRVGDTSPRAVDFRVVAATHRDLSKRLSTGEFREDLFYRLSVLPVHVPALRDRPMDILPLAEHFLSAHGTLSGMTAEVRSSLRRYDWPGNVRELENVVERASVLKTSGFMEREDLPTALLEGPRRPVIGLDVPSEGIDMAETLDRLEANLLSRALKKASGNKARAARLLGLNRTTFVEKLKRRRIDYEG